MFKKIIILISTVLLLLGCSATGPKFTQLESLDTNKAKVYVYRPWAMLDGAAAPTVQVNGKDRFDLSNGGYEVITLSPGTHKLTVKKGAFMSNWRADEMNIEYKFEANKNYFVRLSAELQDAGVYGSVISISGSYGFALIKESFAINELKEVKKN
ncbi:DUF2846 domain-containing protein [Pseudoalteromonas piscicida]|uniref:DUF2846 domain-containing protein n=1 Tax=Pseudoalteromonas piscicida TaxID=43662 RepID=A0AAQ2EQQ7_PSEO7|nr:MULTISPECIES: DUF2846 domain-containing protein [Pseudoalteromonas]KJY83541.1 hypothetical protein TW75_21210 [Pseudoalteromonas piscicida]MDP4487119.1 DUF2846 domain-containing protein [Pseudoalteromonas piscicida]TMN32997.1 DUF2846 domain-containing protein [Pseudoalteromonas piscicida]TMN33779.1 DUF2846 domain-containing protein [Pseudoalteromonas piscicida]TMN46328.1 DUF2846 domain-containing protein [Pseudoalteromonas piscicida]